MKAAIKSGKGKLITSTIFFVLALICLGLGIYFFAGASGSDDVWTRIEIVFDLLLGFVVFIVIAFVLNISYRNHVMIPGALSTAMYAVSFFLFVLLVFALGYTKSVSNSRKKVSVEDENGNEYKLKQVDSGSDEFKDEDGNLWRMKDDGETFKRIDKIVKDEDGNKHTLTPRFPGSETYYRDENGDDWTTYDDGKTFRRD